MVRSSSFGMAALLSLLVPLAWACSDSESGSDGLPAGAGGTGQGSGTGGAVEPDPPGVDPCEEQDCASWCDADTWGGTVPDASTDVVVGAGELVQIDCDAKARTLTIEEGGGIVASRSVSATLTMHGNLIVYGLLDYGSPGARVPSGVQAEILFTGMQDDLYAGTPSTVFGGDEFAPSVLTPMEVLEGDIGLWVMGSGTLRAAGVEKKAWSPLTEGAGPGDPTFAVIDAAGWEPGDRVALTPTAPRSESGALDQYDELLIDAVDESSITLASAPDFDHAGCSDCTRRGEAVNLTRNVVLRSADDEAHAHIMVAEEGIAQLDSVELRWLGPEQCGGPARRSPLTFHQQEEASAASFVRHTSIWGGDKGGVWIERSHGIEVHDVAVYDSYDTAFSVRYDNSACGTRCTDSDTSSPHDVLLSEALAAKVGVPLRSEGCSRIGHRHAGFVLGGAENSGCLGCAAVGIGHEGSGADVSGFQWPEGGSGRPLEFTFDDNVSHHNNGHGLFIWHNGAQPQAPYLNNVVFSNEQHGIHWGAYGNKYVLENFTAVDNAVASIGVKAIPNDDRARLDGGSIDDIRILSYVSVQSTPNIIRDMTFTGSKPVGVSQVNEACSGGNPNDPQDKECLRVWLRFESPTFPSGMNPFLFGESINHHALWEVRGMSHPDYPGLEDFDLHHRDNQVAGGSYHAAFDAWLVPK